MRLPGSWRTTTNVSGSLHLFRILMPSHVARETCRLHRIGNNAGSSRATEFPYLGNGNLIALIKQVNP